MIPECRDHIDALASPPTFCFLAGNPSCENIVHTPIHIPLPECGPAAFEVAYLLIPACFMIGCGSRVILETI